MSSSQSSRPRRTERETIPNGASDRPGWLSLGPQENVLAVFDAGCLLTIEAAANGIPRHGDGHHLLGTASSQEEAVAITTILRLFNPN